MSFQAAWESKASFSSQAGCFAGITCDVFWLTDANGVCFLFVSQATSSEPGTDKAEIFKAVAASAAAAVTTALGTAATAAAHVAASKAAAATAAEVSAAAGKTTAAERMPSLRSVQMLVSTCVVQIPSHQYMEYTATT